MKFHTIDQLIEYAEDMEQTESFIVGPSHTNHQRAVYMIGGVQILIDTRLPHNWLKPSEEWYWTGDYMSEDQASNFASKYNARVEDAYYSDHNEKQLMFDELNDLLRWVFEHRKTELERDVHAE